MKNLAYMNTTTTLSFVSSSTLLLGFLTLTIFPWMLLHKEKQLRLQSTQLGRVQQKLKEQSDFQSDHRMYKLGKFYSRHEYLF